MRTPRLRLLSAILAVALFFTLLPVSALAEDSGSNANTGLTIGIVGNLNHWDESHSISMKEVSPAVYEVTIENKSYGDINGSVGFMFVKGLRRFYVCKGQQLGQFLGIWHSFQRRIV